MNREIFQSVANESAGRRGYSHELHVRVCELAEDWLSRNGSPAAAGGEHGFDEDVQQCSAWVCAQYQHEFGIPVIGWLLWPVISGLINWLVQRTLARMFPSTSRSAS